MNTFKTALLLTTLTISLMAVGAYFRGRDGMIVAFAIAAATNFVSYFYSDRMALAMYRAVPVTRAELPRAYQVVERMAGRMNIPMPRIYVIPDDSPNAFATGRNPSHAAVAVTRGILSLLDDEELEGVLAHELGHVRNRDILTSSVAATLAGAITMLASFARWGMIFGGFGGGGRRERGGGGIGALAMILVAPIAATLIQLWISRTREFEADATGAHITGNPYALARALEKLDAYSRRLPLQASAATAHLFIVAPLISSGGIASLFATHPPIKDRIARLVGRPMNGPVGLR
jgi:heat shock protein HtpX